MNARAMARSTNLLAEQLLIGSLLRTGMVTDYAVGKLRGEMFADPIHGAVFERLRDYDKRDREAPLLIDDTRAAPCELSLILQEVGGVGYLEGLTMQFSDVPRETAVVAVNKIRDAWAKRGVMAATDIMPGLASQAFDAANDREPVDVFLEYLIGRVISLLEKLEALRAPAP